MLISSSEKQKEILELQEHKNSRTWNLAQELRYPGRAAYAVETNHIYLNFSRNHFDTTTFSLLHNLLRSWNFDKLRHALFRGEKINHTEKRAVIHTALRNNGIDLPDLILRQEVQDSLEAVKTFTQKIHSGEFTGATGKKFKHIVNIGIGGSEAGPRMVIHALQQFKQPGLPEVHFLSATDPRSHQTLEQKIDLEETLFITISKSFSTLETVTNANIWVEKLNSALGVEAYKHHFAAATANSEKAASFGISPDMILEFPESVGGRFSLWSSAGVAIALAFGFPVFEALLCGAKEMDRAFLHEPLDNNAPVILALLSYWYTNLWNYSSQGIIPYFDELKELPSYLQQLEMESNGKSTDREGNPVNYPTSPVIWGGLGQNSQHSFFQLFHQGKQVIPLDFIGLIPEKRDKLSDILTANMAAQAEALTLGGQMGSDKENMAPYRFFPGNRPSNTILLKGLTPESIGSLLAMYEHKVFTLGVLWNLNSFDQWGVELGKQAASTIQAKLSQKEGIPSFDDPVTQAIIDQYLKH